MLAKYKRCLSLILVTAALIIFSGCNARQDNDILMPQYESTISGDYHYVRTYQTYSDFEKAIDLGATDWVVRYKDIAFLGEFDYYFTYTMSPEFAGKREHINQNFSLKNKNGEFFYLQIKQSHDEANPQNFREKEWQQMTMRAVPMPEINNFMRVADEMDPTSKYLFRGILYEYGADDCLSTISWYNGRSIVIIHLYEELFFGIEYDKTDEDSIIAQLVDPTKAETAVDRINKAVLGPYYRSLFMKSIPVFLIASVTIAVVIIWYFKRRNHNRHIKQLVAQASGFRLKE